MDTKHPGWIAVWASTALLAFLGVCGTLLSVATAYEIPLDAGLFVGFSVLLALYITLAVSLPKYGKYLSVLAVLVMGVCCAVYFRTLRVGAQNTVLQIRNKLAIAIPFVTRLLEPEGVTELLQLQGDLLFLLLMAFLMTYFISWALIRAQSLSLSAVATVPLFGLALVYTDYPPSALSLCLMTSYYAILFLTHVVRRGNLAESARMTLLLAPVTLLLSALLFAGVSKMTEVPVIPLDTLEEELSDAYEKTQQAFQSASNSAKSQENLRSVGKKDQSETVVMQVLSSGGGKLYLRGYSLGQYTGSAWLAVEEYADGGDVNLSAALPYLGFAGGGAGSAETLEVTYARSSTLLHIPYYVAAADGAIRCTEQAWYAADRQIGYHCSYLAIPDIQAATFSLTGDAAAWESAYRQYVLSAYTVLEPDTRDAVLAIAEGAGISADADRYTLAQQVSAYIRNAAAYELSVPQMPSDGDFVLYFLNDCKSGYCVHFASAAAVMLQALGVPARYVSGYLVQTEANVQTDVTAADAHAWVEVYLDGIGWMPIEATGSRTPDELSGTPAPSDTPEPTSSPEATPEPTAAPTQEPTELPASAEPSAEAGQTPEPAADAAVTPSADASEPGGSPGADASGGDAGADEGRGAPPLWLLYFLIPVLVVLVALFRRSAVLEARRRAIYRRNGSRSVIAAYQYLKKLARWGVSCPPEIEALAMKAAFSQHALTPEERAQVLSHLESELRKLAAGQTPLMRFVCRYILVLY